MKMNDKKNQKLENIKKFILATQQLIDENGIENISIRKIANMTGLHNSTIYLYFEDFDQLIMLASVKYFAEYNYALMLYEQTVTLPNEKFIDIWGFFIDAILKKPEIFYNFFFGKKSDNLQEILLLYYDIFPDEKYTLSETIENMYYGKNITYRCLNLLQTLLTEENQVNETNLVLINDIIVSFFKYKLEQKCQNPFLDSESIKQDILRAIYHITGIHPSKKVDI